MKVIPTSLAGLVLLEPESFADDRGSFFESFNEAQFVAATGCTDRFVQDDHSVSRAGVLRGLHYQLPRAQGKIVRVAQGEVFDVVVDLRRSSPTLGRHFSTTLTGENRRMLWIPSGFAHGFLALSTWAMVLYKVTGYWAPDCQHCIAWDDRDLAIDWPLDRVQAASGLGIERPILSAKDAAGVAYSRAALFD